MDVATPASFMFNMMELIFEVVLPLLLDLLLSSVLEVELDTLHSAFVDMATAECSLI